LCAILTHVLGDILLGFAALLTLFLCVTLAWHVFHPVPFVATPYPVIREMIRLTDLKGRETVYDLGAGDGRLLAEVLRLHPSVRAIGYEIIPTVWLLGMLRRCVSRRPFTLRLRNALKADVSDADAVFLYLFPTVMGDLKQLFDRQLRPGTPVVSNTFRIPGKTEESSSQVRLATGRIVTIHVYRW